MSVPRCARCNRVLKDAASIACGLGPTCFAKLTGQTLKKSKSQRQPAVRKSKRPVPAAHLPADGTMSLDEWTAIKEAMPQEEQEEEIQIEVECEDDEKPQI